MNNASSLDRLAQPSMLGEDPFSAAGVKRATSLRSNEQTVMALFDAFSRDRLEDAMPLLDPDIVFQPMTAEVTRAGEPYRGHEGMRSYARDVRANWDELTLRPTQIRATGNAVAALGLVSGRGRAGSFQGAPTTWMFKFKDGLVCNIQIFSEARNVHQALDAAA
jgi:ketosteroid isomerase-like protein